MTIQVSEQLQASKSPWLRLLDDGQPGVYSAATGLACRRWLSVELHRRLQLGASNVRQHARQSVDGAVDEDGAADGPIAPRKLEVQRYIVNGKKPGRVDRSRADEQKDGVDIPHKLAGEDASRHAAAGQLPSSSSA